MDYHGPSGKWIEGIGPDGSVDDAARRSLEPRLTAVVHWLPLAAYLAEHDVEHVHRLRVSTRRAVAALKLYRDWLPRKQRRWVKKRLKKIRRAAGDARDLDVLAERLARDYGERVGAGRATDCARSAPRCSRRSSISPSAAAATIASSARRPSCLRRFDRPTSRDNAHERRHFRDWAAEQLASVGRAVLCARCRRDSRHGRAASVSHSRQGASLRDRARGPGLRSGAARRSIIRSSKNCRSGSARFRITSPRRALAANGPTDASTMPTCKRRYARLAEDEDATA